MLLFEISMYFKRNKVKLLIITFLLILASIFSKTNVYNLLYFSNLLLDNAVLTFPDYLIGILNSVQFIMFFVFPVLFSILVSDIINSDYHNGFINLILSRIKKRSYYIIIKCTMVFLLSILFACLVFLAAFLVAIIFNIPFSNNKYHYIFQIISKTDGAILMIYMSMISIFIFGLTFIGLLTLVIAVYTGSAGIAVGFIIILGFVHNAFYVISNDLLVWLPFSQYIVGLHNHFAPFGISVSYFTMNFSNIYIFLAIVLMILLFGVKIRKIEINNIRGER